MNYRTLLSGIFLLTLVSACQPQIKSNEPQKPILISSQSKGNATCQIVTHAWGKTELCQTPKRIIALDSHSLDLLSTLGLNPVGYAEDQRALVGAPQLGEAVQQVKYLGQYLQVLPKHVGTWQTPSQETMLKLQPDLILSTSLDESQYNNFSQIAPTLLPITDWGNPRIWKKNLEVIAELLDQSKLATDFIHQYEQNLEKTKTQLANQRDRRVLLLSMSGIEHIGIFDSKTFPGAILQDLGFELMLPSGAIAAEGEIPISMEILPSIKADFIVVMVSGSTQVSEMKNLWATHPILKSLSVQQKQTIHFVDYQLWNRIQGPNSANLVVSQIQDWFIPKTVVSPYETEDHN